MRVTIRALFIFFVISMMSTLAFAQSYYSEGYSPQDYSSQDIAEIKSNITYLLEENKSLEEKRLRLKNELYELQVVTDQVKAGFEQVEQESSWQKERRRLNQKSLKNLGGDVDALKNEILIKKSKLAFLKGQLIDLDKKLSLWRLRLSDAEYEKRQLEIEKKTKEFSSDEKQENKREVYERLQREVSQLEKENKKLTKEIDEIKEARVMYPQSVINLKNDNLELQYRIDDVKTQSLIKKKEVSILEDKKLLKDLQFNKENDPYIQHHKALTDKVQKLEKEYNALNEAVELSLSKKNEKRKLMQDIIRLDRENQDLLNEIARVESTLNSAKQ